MILEELPPQKIMTQSEHDHSNRLSTIQNMSLKKLQLSGFFLFSEVVLYDHNPLVIMHKIKISTSLRTQGSICQKMPGSS